MYLIFDTETTGLPRSWNAPASDVDNWPRAVQLAWEVYDGQGHRKRWESFLIRPEGFQVPKDAERIHGISTKKALIEGRALVDVIDAFAKEVQGARVLVSHNIRFDGNVIAAEFHRVGRRSKLHYKTSVCTMSASTEFCGIPGPYGFKWPTLSELYSTLFGKRLKEAHDASVDVSACAKCFFELKRRGIVRLVRGRGA